MNVKKVCDLDFRVLDMVGLRWNDSSPKYPNLPNIKYIKESDDIIF